MAAWRLIQPVLEVVANHQGRDFVVGDLHGSLELLTEALATLEFDRQVDRLFSVGDLIDRGPSSMQLLSWLGEPWFFACVGNHESVLLDYMNSESPNVAQNWQQFGGAWFFQLTRDEQLNIADKIRNHMHVAIEIQSSLGQPDVGIVHADVPYQLSWHEFKQSIAAQEEDVVYQTLWSRQRGRGELQSEVKGVRLVVCGHEIVAKAHKRANVWLLDTGAYLSGVARGKLSLLELPETLRDFTLPSTKS